MRTLAKSSEGMVKQRKGMYLTLLCFLHPSLPFHLPFFPSLELAMAHQDIATALAACTEDAEDPSAREAALLGQVEERVQELQARFHTTEMTGIEAILDEYVRLIKSAKVTRVTKPIGEPIGPPPSPPLLSHFHKQSHSSLPPLVPLPLSSWPTQQGSSCGKAGNRLNENSGGKGRRWKRPEHKLPLGSQWFQRR